MPAVECEALDALVASVSNHEYRLRAALIDDEAVRAAQLTGLFAGSTERSNVLAFTVVLKQVAGAIAVADIDIAIRRDGYIGRAVFERFTLCAGFCIRFRMLGITEREDFLTVQAGFDHETTLNIAKVKEFFFRFTPDVGDHARRP